MPWRLEAATIYNPFKKKHDGDGQRQPLTPSSLPAACCLPAIKRHHVQLQLPWIPPLYDPRAPYLSLDSDIMSVDGTQP